MAEPDPAPVQPPPPQALIRMIHAAVDEHDHAVRLVAGDVQTSPAAFQFASSYVGLTPGDHPISARADDTELIGADFSLPEGQWTLIAYSTGDFPVALVHMPDATAPAPAESAQIRVFHALVGQGALDVCTPPAAPRGDGTPLLANVAAGSLASTDGGYLAVPAGSELPVQIRAHHATPCHGRIVGTARGFVPASESNYTLVLVGRTGRRGIPPELLFCADPPAIDTSCATLPFDAR